MKNSLLTPLTIASIAFMVACEASSPAPGVPGGNDSTAGSGDQTETLQPTTSDNASSAQPKEDGTVPSSGSDASTGPATKMDSGATMVEDTGVTPDGNASANPNNAGSGTTPSGGTGGTTTPVTPFDGPLDGDPNKPMVEIPGVACGPMQGLAFMSSPPTVKITNRDVVLLYPCAHEGAAVTFFLLLHGTVDEPMKVPFTMNAWAIHELIDSHNIILAVPKAIGTQWGNGDNGEDLPHLYEVVDWIYDTFGEKFNIRSMWAQGGSWGAMYLSMVFACDPRFESRLKGIQLVVGGGCPRCSDRLSCQVMQQELEKGGGSPITDDAKEQLTVAANIEPYANMHGCGAKIGPEDVGTVKTWAWPNCSPGWVHSYYLGPGNHADAWDKAAVLRATEEMKSTEQ